LLNNLQKIFKKLINAKNVCKLYQNALKIDSTLSIKECENFLITHLKILKNSDEFNNLPKENIIKLYSLYVDNSNNEDDENNEDKEDSE
jgi:hypothetical protein